MAFTVTESNRVVVVQGGTGVITLNTWAVSRFRFVSATGQAADVCLVEDSTGARIWESNVQGAQWSEETDFSKVPAICNGLTLTTLTGNRGILYIYLR